MPVPSTQKIIRTYLLIVGIYTLSASLIWGINTLFLLDAGLNIFQVFLVNAVFTGSMTLFEIPTGVLADARGRRTSFLLSMAVILLGTIAYVLIPRMDGGLVGFSLASVVLGLGYTFYSGATEAWLVDALKASGSEGRLDQIFARSAMVSGAAMLIGTTSGGLLGTIDLAWPFVVRALLLAAVLGIAWSMMHDIGFQPQAVSLGQMPAEMKKLTRASITFGWQQRPVRLLMIISFIQGTFMAWGFYAWQPYILDLLGQNLPWVTGVIAALISLATIAGNFLVERLTRFCGRRTTIMLGAAIVQTAAIIGVGLTSSFWLAIVLFLIVMATTGVWGPVRQAYLHRLIPSKQRATVLSFDSLVNNGGSVLGQTGLGRLSQTRSIASGYVTSGLITLLVLPVLWRLRAGQDAEDRIRAAAGEGSHCAAQGIPNVSAVETVGQVATNTD